MLIEKRLIDIEPAIDQHAIAQPAARVYRQRPHPAAGAVVDLVRFDPANLRGVDEFGRIDRSRLCHAFLPLYDGLPEWWYNNRRDWLDKETFSCPFTNTPARAAMRNSITSPAQ